MEKRVLGRGLAALISGTQEINKTQIESPVKQGIVNISVDKIKANKYQPREEFDTESHKELITSIREKGIIQPVLIRLLSSGEYELIAGERRLRAAKELGYKEIPAIIKDASDRDSLELSIIENIQREDLNPIDQAKAYQRLLEEFNMTQEQVADTIGKDRSTVTNILRLLKLPRKIQEYVSRGTISMGHAKAIMSLDSESEQLQLCSDIVKNDLSVRATECYVKKLFSKKQKKFKKSIILDPNILAIQTELSERLGAKVRIIKSKKGGRIEIEFYSDGDLERVITLLKSNR